MYSIYSMHNCITMLNVCIWRFFRFNNTTVHFSSVGWKVLHESFYWFNQKIRLRGTIRSRFPRKEMILPPSWTMAAATRKKALRFFSQFGAFILTRFGFWNCFSMLMLFAERADVKRYVKSSVDRLQWCSINTCDLQSFNKRIFIMKVLVLKLDLTDVFVHHHA